MLECRKLRKTFSGFVATNDVSLTVETGSITAIIHSLLPSSEPASANGH